MLFGKGGTGGVWCPRADLARGIRLGDDGVLGLLLGRGISPTIGEVGREVGVLGRGIKDGVSDLRAYGETARSRSRSGYGIGS
jgi:hypothetical protein